MPIQVGAVGQKQKWSLFEMHDWQFLVSVRILDKILVLVGCA